MGKQVEGKFVADVHHHLLQAVEGLLLLGTKVRLLVKQLSSAMFEQLG